jgi:hypothetical protein
VQPRFDQIRRGFHSRGLTTAVALPKAVEGRPDDYRLVRSTLVESDRLEWHDVGPPAPCPEPLGFVDGIQHYEVVGYEPPLPIVGAEIAAAVRLRVGGEYRTIERERHRFLVGRAGLVDRWAEGSGLPTLATDADEVEHPLKELERIHRAIDQARSDLERKVALRFRTRYPHWLIVDGVISDSEPLAGDARVVGVSKSHGTLPFAGDELARYLQLPPGHRTTVFEPATWRVAPVYSRGLRLWPWQGQDLLHG